MANLLQRLSAKLASFVVSPAFCPDSTASLGSKASFNVLLIGKRQFDLEERKGE